MTLAPVSILISFTGFNSDIALETPTVPRPKTSSFVLVVTVPLPRADMTTRPTLFSSEFSPRVIVARSWVDLISESARAPEIAPPVAKVTVSWASIVFSARSIKRSSFDSEPTTSSDAFVLITTSVVISRMVDEVALAPLTSPPVAPRILSSTSGFLNTLPAPISMLDAVICASSPTVDDTWD